ncbi:hypothetical protein IVB41_12225 [Bradyrhizobium sp. 44]|uniref:hypothetical protein n=1 Tax=Bradyrhizobium sp. 44 TaxID=2782675 RepID=UPI001FFA2406|nr:hypothetical protein [Bradyrhizobium sp. 44]MCK1284684.1 hypothetical protein [Bradyrhizobium sp. 44]
MNDRPASWRMPTPKQMEKMAAAAGKKPPRPPGLAPEEDLPPEYWQALLDDSRAGGDGPGSGASRRGLSLSRIPQHVLRVVCRRCAGIVEIQKADAARLYGSDAIWKDAGRRLLDSTCTQRTRNHEEDGCWPVFE